MTAASEPKRYANTTGGLVLSSWGDYVTLADYLALRAECEAKDALLESAADWLVAGVQQYEQTSEDSAGGYMSPWDEAADKLASKIRAAIDAGREGA